VVLDSTRPDLRRRLAEVLYEEAVIAGEDHDDDRANDLVERLEVYDSGEFTRRLIAPAHLAITTHPVAAAIEIERYRNSGNGVRSPEEPITGGSTPLADLALEPGSYRLTFRAAGRVVVRFPLLV